MERERGGATPQNSYFIKDPITDNDKVFLTKVIDSLREGAYVVQKTNCGYDRYISARIETPVKGRVRILYNRNHQSVLVFSLVIYDNERIEDEFSEVEYHGMEYMQNTSEYRKIVEMEDIYAERVEREMKRKAAEKRAKKRKTIEKYLIK